MLSDPARKTTTPTDNMFFCENKRCLLVLSIIPLNCIKIGQVERQLWRFNVFKVIQVISLSNYFYTYLS